MKTFTTDWKRSYWPEPRFGGKRESRAETCKRLKGARDARRMVCKEERLRRALNAD